MICFQFVRIQNKVSVHKQNFYLNWLQKIMGKADAIYEYAPETVATFSTTPEQSAKNGYRSTTI